MKITVGGPVYGYCTGFPFMGKLEIPEGDRCLATYNCPLFLYSSGGDFCRVYGPLNKQYRHPQCVIEYPNGGEIILVKK